MGVHAMTKRAVFLDRDGTINTMVYNPDFGLVDSPAKPGEFELLPGVGEAIRAINQMGLLAVVISNQPGVAKGKLTLQLLEEITKKMHQELAKKGGILDAVYYCLHHVDASVNQYRVVCNCRKPQPGLLIKAAQELDINLSQSYMIGDGITDILAGQVVGATTMFVGNRKCYTCDEFSRQGVQSDYIVEDLPQAVKIIQSIETRSGAIPAQSKSIIGVTGSRKVVHRSFP
jgi:D-glycero-D-manno-heptose 1,7-bisphosphate phosphatase